MTTTAQIWRTYVCGAPCITYDAQGRIDRIRASSDLTWLRAIVADADTQKTVRAAAERRIRAISK